MAYQKQFNSIPETALVLSAGFGSRLSPITNSIPKAMVEVAGQKVVDYAIDGLNEFGIKNIVVNTHYKAEMLEGYLKNHYQQTPINISFSREDEILETGGGILKVLQDKNCDSLIIKSCDTLFDPGLAKVLTRMAEVWQSSDIDFLAALVPWQKTTLPKGDFCLEKGNLIRKVQDNDYVFAGCYFLKRKIFTDLEVHKFSITKILFTMKNLPFSFKGMVFEDLNWFDIGTLQSLELANNHFDK